MSFDICPDAAIAALLGKPAGAPISLAPTEAMRKFVPPPDYVGPDPPAQNVLTTFMRIAMAGGPTVPALQRSSHRWPTIRTGPVAAGQQWQALRRRRRIVRRHPFELDGIHA